MGHGYGYEAALNTLKYLFSKYQTNEYIATSDPSNVASIKILTKLGYKKISQIIDENQEIEVFMLTRQNYKALNET